MINQSYKALQRLAAAFVLLMTFCAVAPAQSLIPDTSVTTTPDAIALPEPLTPETVRELVSRLSDADVRGLLLRQLDAAVEKETQSAETEFNFIDFAEQSALGIAKGFQMSVNRVPLLYDGLVRSFTTFYEARGASGFWKFVGVILAAIGLGLVAEYAVTRFASGWRAQINNEFAHQSMSECLKSLGLRLLLDIIGLLAFFAVARTVTFTIGDPADIPFTRLIMINLVVLPRLVAAFSRFLLAPNRPELRIVHTDDATAKYLHRNQIGLVLFIGLSTTLVSFGILNGVPLGETRLGFWLNLLAHIYLCVIAFQARKGLAMMLLGTDGDVTPMEARVARAYPWFAFWLSIVAWVVVEIIAGQGLFHLISKNQHFMTMFLLLMAPALDTTIRGMVKYLAGPMQGGGALAEAAHQETKRSYIRIGRVLVFAVVITLIAWIWQIEFSNLASAGFGAVIAGRMIEVLFVAAFGYLALEVLNLWINHKLATEYSLVGSDENPEEPGGGEGGGAGGSRLSTILPLLHGVARVAIIVVFSLIALGGMGIDITPLLAGAGIVGLAVGFGAQKLVQDVVSGMFFLFDDAFRTGEFVDIDGTVGTVEKISIRSMQLRHHRGAVHTIPYGEIPKITNYSRDWVIMKLKFTVPFETDLNRVKKIFKQIGAELMADPLFKDDLLQPFKSQGVLDVDDVGIILRGKFMAKPGKQFTLRKEIYSRIKLAFEANNIDFARREVRVAIPGIDEGQPLTEDQKAAVHTAAAAVAETAKEPQ